MAANNKSIDFNNFLKDLKKETKDILQNFLRLQEMASHFLHNFSKDIDEIEEHLSEEEVKIARSLLRESAVNQVAVNYIDIRKIENALADLENKEG